MLARALYKLIFYYMDIEELYSSPPTLSVSPSPCLQPFLPVPFHLSQRPLPDRLMHSLVPHHHKLIENPNKRPERPLHDRMAPIWRTRISITLCAPCAPDSPQHGLGIIPRVRYQ